MGTETAARVRQAGVRGVPGVCVVWLGSFLGPAASNNLFIPLQLRGDEGGRAWGWFRAPSSVVDRRRSMEC